MGVSFSFVGHAFEFWLYSCGCDFMPIIRLVFSNDLWPKLVCRIDEVLGVLNDACLQTVFIIYIMRVSISTGLNVAG